MPFPAQSRLLAKLAPMSREAVRHLMDQSEIMGSATMARNPQNIDVLGRYEKGSWCRLRDSNT